MKNKGFTLIELLVVITILSLVGILVSVNFSETLDDTKQKECTAFVNEVEDAACVYVGLIDKSIECTRTNCSPIKLEILINEGLIKSEIDACTGNSINKNETVSVTWDSNGEKKCEYNGVNVYER